MKLKSILVLPVFLLIATSAHAGSSNAGIVDRLLAAARERTLHTVRYDGRYMRIPYPNGDVPKNIGVCTDVVIRSYRKLGIDLQKLVHEDMLAHFSRYPSKRIWGMSHPDSNIDHRRVPNLQVFFKRYGQSLKVSNNPSDYLPGDLVTWMLPGNLPHIGIVSKQRSVDGKRPKIIHNIGEGPEIGDMMFDYPITGHYRYTVFPKDGRQETANNG